MSRIYTNVNSIIAQNSLAKSNTDLNTRLSRLSSGLRIKSGKDDPAGLIASETLRSEMAGVGQAIDNAERANSVISTAEGALNEVSSLLLDVKSLINNSANEGGLAPEEIAANQLQIDSAIQSINRIANSTQFEGVKLLNGEMDFVVSGLAASEMTDMILNEVRFGTASSVSATLEVTDSAEKGYLLISNTETTLESSVTLEIKGNKGVEVLSFAESATLTAMVAAINQVKDVTGVSANATSTELSMFSTEYGSDQFVSVEKISGGLNLGVENSAGDPATRGYGADIVAAVNGVECVSDGLNISMNGPTFAFTAKVAEGKNTGGTAAEFDVTGGGAQFQLGQNVNAQQQSIVGIQSIAAHRLGTAENGYLRDVLAGGSASVEGANYAEADAIIDDAISIVAQMRGRLGAFQKNTLDTTMNSLNVALENLTASESAIRDADFAEETAALTRAQILQQAGTSVLSLANSSPQNVLALLG